MIYDFIKKSADNDLPAEFLLLRKVYQKGDRLLFSFFEKSSLSPFWLFYAERAFNL
jgi:hypothetical protein